MRAGIIVLVAYVLASSLLFAGQLGEPQERIYAQAARDSLKGNALPETRAQQEKMHAQIALDSVKAGLPPGASLFGNSGYGNALIFQSKNGEPEGLAPSNRFEEKKPGNSPEMNGYLVKLRGSPLADAIAGELDGGMEKAAEISKAQKTVLEKEHEAARTEIAMLAGTNIVREYFNAFNGFALVASQEEAESLKKSEYVAAVYPNYQVKAYLNESVPLIRADSVWKLDRNGNNCTVSGEECLTGKEIRIAIIDTGVDYLHPDLGGCFGNGCKVADGYDFVNMDDDPVDDHGHGTHVAATAAGKGALYGVAPDAKIYAYKVLNQKGDGWESDIVAGIERAMDPNQDGDFSDHADIISMSLGGVGDPDDPMSSAIDKATKIGIVSTIAAGNAGHFGEGHIGSPGTARSAITVGATYKMEPPHNRVWFSSTGPVEWANKSIIKPDVMAPGYDICAAMLGGNPISGTPCLDSQHITLSGTSMATPHVAGVVALMKQKNPDWSPQEIKLALRGSARDTLEKMTYQGYGFVDAYAAVFSKQPPVAQLGDIDASKGGSIDIRGTAAYVGSVIGQRRHSIIYQLCIAEGIAYLNDSGYRCFYKSDQPVVDGVLYQGLDLYELDEGYKTLQLKITADDGSHSEDRAVFYVDNFHIERIGEHLNYVGSGNYSIVGSINFPTLQLRTYSEYRIDYVPVSVNGSLQTLCRGNAEVEPSSTLCTLDTTNLTDGKYRFRLSVYRNGKWYDDEAFEASVVHEMLPNWPAKVSDCFALGVPVFSDIDNDGKEEVSANDATYCRTYYGGGYAMGSMMKILKDGNITKSIYGLTGSNGTAIYLYPGMGGSPTLYPDHEAGRDFFLLANSGISYANPNLVFTADENGTVVRDPYSPQTNGSESTASYPSVLPTGQEGEAGSTYLMMYDDELGRFKSRGFAENGDALPGFVIQHDNDSLPNSMALMQIGTSFNGTAKNFVAIAGEGEGSHVIIYADLYANDSQRLARSYLFTNFSQNVRIYASRMAFADLDNDGKTETVWSYGIVDADLFNQNKFNPEAYKTYVVVLGSNGSILSRPFEIQGYLPNKLAIGNLGGERLKVVLALSDTWPTTYNGQKLVAFDYLGNGGFNINLSDYNYIITDLLAGNIDSDGKTEVIVTHRPRWWDRMDSGVLVYGNEGILKRSIPLPTFGETDMFYNAALTDFDGDGSVDIALQSDYIGKNYNGRQTRIFILSLGGSYSEEKMDWPMETHDYQRTSAYGKRANAAPRIISFSGPANITANQGADFGWTAIDYNGDDLSWAIAWGDGASVEMNCPAGAGCSQFNASYKWLIPGNYTINATVTDGHGGVARKIYQVQVGGGSANRAPVITGIKGPSVLNASQAGVWRVSAYDPENGSLSFDVVWGDEPKKARDAATDKTKAMNVSFSHIYYDAGTYTVQFTVTDEEGASAYANATVLVAPAISNSPPVIETCTLPTSIVANQSASIGCVASDPDGNEDIGNWTVAWGDGSGGAYGCAMGAICNTFSETHTWSMPGDYGVTISVSDRHGASNATTFQVQVSAKIATECPKSAVPESCTSGYDLYAYEQFGYTDKNGCVVYGCGERNSEE